MPASAGSVHPSYLTWMGVAREATTATAVMPTGALPLEPNSYDIEDTPVFLPDTAIRGSMTYLFNEILGPQDAAFSFGGPAYLDVEGYLFDNMFGDLASSGINAGSASTLNAPTVIGATIATLTSSSGYLNGNNVQIGGGNAGTINTCEVVTLSQASSGGTIYFGLTPLRFAHGSGATTQVVTGPYTHRFATTNQGSGQPPTHTLTDYTGVTPSVGARSYVSACTAQLDLSGNAEQLLMWKVSGNAWTSAPSSTTPTAFTSFVVPIANWRGSVFVGGAYSNGQVTGGTAFQNIGEWSVAYKRKLQVYWTAQGTNNPYFIARGPLDATGSLNYALAQGTDETPLTNMLTNAQPPVTVAINNGQSGASVNYLGLILNLSQAAFVKSKPMRTGELFTYQDEYQCVANTNDVGGSGGLAPGSLTLINNVPTY
jgi:hypothetical protein